ncbi:MAG TPA: sortase [Dehalococcoidia bacterium]|nr:sortase [Dehalococcoidia bacterium]
MADGAMRRVPRRVFLGRYLGNAMLAAGGSLVGAATAYQIYRHQAEADLGSLRRGSVTIPGAPVAPAVLTGAQASVAPAGSPGGAPSTASAAPPTPADGSEPAVFAAQTPAPSAASVSPELRPVRLRIESIGLSDVPVVEVGTRLEKGQLVWETADHAVGHLIGTGLPGSPGNMVLAGHISSPVKGEGSVFRNLPAIANKLGSRVSVQTAAGNWFHYTITGTNVVLPTDTWVMDTATAPVVTLLTCVPDGVYTHRFVALGRLAA